VKYDVLIHNALIVDGSGETGYQADLAIVKDRIVAIGRLSAADAIIVKNGEGLVLAPGFIDVHTHDDLQVIRAPDMLPKISQGITTVIAASVPVR
jgi:N-acyl-D-amino-acid deacylase